MDVKELAKKLCDESGCHHKCKEIDECVVMEEAEEVIANYATTTGKSNNLTFVLTNEDKVSVKGKYIDADALIKVLKADYNDEGLNVEVSEEKHLIHEVRKYSYGQSIYLKAIERVKEAMEVGVMNKEKQIEEMAKTILVFVHTKHNLISLYDLAEALYNAGYRKQSEETPCTTEQLTTDITYLKDYLKKGGE